MRPPDFVPHDCQILVRDPSFTQDEEAVLLDGDDCRREVLGGVTPVHNGVDGRTEGGPRLSGRPSWGITALVRARHRKGTSTSVDDLDRRLVSGEPDANGGTAVGVESHDLMRQIRACRDDDGERPRPEPGGEGKRSLVEPDRYRPDVAYGRHQNGEGLAPWSALDIEDPIERLRFVERRGDPVDGVGWDGYDGALTDRSNDPFDC